MKNRLLLLVTSLMVLSAVNAQEIWSLSQCIDHALTNNITIKQQELNTQREKNLLQQSKNNRLPNLNASVSQNFGFGRVKDNDGVLQSTDAATSQFSLGTNVPVWEGGKLKNNIEKQKFEMQSGLENLEKAKDDITIAIAQAYLEVLFAEEVLKVAETQLEQTKMQIVRTEHLVTAGKLAEGVLLEIKAQEARESLEVVNAKNECTMSLLNLTQILEFDDYTAFEIEQPVLPEMQAELAILEAKTVYETAIKTRPEIKSAEYMLDSYNSQLKIAKSDRLPSLSASAGLSDNFTSYYSDNDPSFSDQMSVNKSSYVSLSLNIPLFNRCLVNSGIKNAKIQIESSRLDLEAAKKELRRQIEQAYINAFAAFERYNANKVAVASMEESFRYMQQKFDLGRVNSVEYNDSKTKLASAQSDLIQAKYEFIFRSKILDFYNGVPIIL